MQQNTKDFAIELITLFGAQNTPFIVNGLTDKIEQFLHAQELQYTQEQNVSFRPYMATLEEKNPNVEEAVNILCEALRTDEGLYIAYQSNIAMAFQDVYNGKDLQDSLHTTSNRAATNFLNLLIDGTRFKPSPLFNRDIYNTMEKRYAILEDLTEESRYFYVHLLQRIEAFREKYNKPYLFLGADIQEINQWLDKHYELITAPDQGINLDGTRKTHIKTESSHTADNGDYTYQSSYSPIPGPDVTADLLDRVAQFFTDMLNGSKVFMYQIEFAKKWLEDLNGHISTKNHLSDMPIIPQHKMDEAYQKGYKAGQNDLSEQVDVYQNLVTISREIIEDIFDHAQNNSTPYKTRVSRQRDNAKHFNKVLHNYIHGNPHKIEIHGRSTGKTQAINSEVITMLNKQIEEYKKSYEALNNELVYLQSKHDKEQKMRLSKQIQLEQLLELGSKAVHAIPDQDLKEPQLNFLRGLWAFNTGNSEEKPKRMAADQTGQLEDDKNTFKNIYHQYADKLAQANKIIDIAHTIIISMSVTTTHTEPGEPTVTKIEHGITSGTPEAVQWLKEYQELKQLLKDYYPGIHSTKESVIVDTKSDEVGKNEASCKNFARAHEQTIDLLSFLDGYAKDNHQYDSWGAMSYRVSPKALNEAYREAIGNYFEYVEKNTDARIGSPVMFEKGLSDLREQIKVQSDKGNYDFSPYMFGMANGLICALANFTGQEPQYLDKPGRWIEKEQKIVNGFTPSPYKRNEAVQNKQKEDLAAQGYKDVTVDAWECENGMRIIHYFAQVWRMTITNPYRSLTWDEIFWARNEFMPANLQIAIVVEPNAKPFTNTINLFELIYTR